MALRRSARALERTGHRQVARRVETDAVLCDAMRQLVRTLPHPPAPRWRYNDCIYPERIRYRPWEPLLTVIDGAIDAAHVAGRTLPEGDALAIVDRITGYVVARVHRDHELPSLRTCCIEETHHQGPADEVQMILMGNPTSADLDRADALLAAHERKIEQLRRRVALERAKHGRLTA